MYEAPVRGVRYHAASQRVYMGADLKQNEIKIFFFFFFFFFFLLFFEIKIMVRQGRK